LGFFHIFPIISQFSSVFSKSYYYSTWVCSLFFISFHNSTRVSWIVKRFGKYRRKLSWIVKRSVKYGRKVSFQNFTIQPTFLPYFSYLLKISSVFSKLFTLQLGFLPYFPYHFTIFID
jgi:hypothetical protein